jgi:hypothetical protein
MQRPYLFRGNAHHPHQLEKIEQQRLGEPLEDKCTIDMFAIEVVFGRDQALNARCFEALKFIVELETRINPKVRAGVNGSQETYRK